ncbi:MAG: flippase [Acidobacteria bacterium]|nr:MAG: flippase [Acidobacteriota bacterium]
MSEGLKSFLSRGLKSSVGKNTLSLYSIQFANYFLPLITIPYLVRVLGAERFGTLAFGQGLMAYFSTAVSFGFDWSATRKISVERERVDIVSRVSANVWGAKSLLCVLSFVCLLLLIQLVPRVHYVSTLMVVLFGGVLGNVLFPTWLFQGLERMGPISWINLSLRTLVVVGMFVLVRKPQDFIIYAGLSSAAAIIAGMLGVGVAFQSLGLRLTLPTWAGILESLREGSVLFLSSSAIVLYSSGNAFILGLMANDTVVGYYTAGEKIVRAMVGILGPLSQALFPRFSRLAEESRARTLYWGKKLLFAVGGTGLVLSAITFISAAPVVRIVLGHNYHPSISVVRILALLPFLVAVSSVLGVQLMIPFGREKAIFLIVLGAGCLNVAFALLLAPGWKANGMAVSVLLAEIFVSTMYFAYLSRSGLSPLQKPGARPNPE